MSKPPFRMVPVLRNTKETSQHSQQSLQKRMNMYENKVPIVETDQSKEALIPHTLYVHTNIEASVSLANFIHEKKLAPMFKLIDVSQDPKPQWLKGVPTITHVTWSQPLEGTMCFHYVEQLKSEINTQKQPELVSNDHTEPAVKDWPYAYSKKSTGGTSMQTLEQVTGSCSSDLSKYDDNLSMSERMEAMRIARKSNIDPARQLK